MTFFTISSPDVRKSRLPEICTSDCCLSKKSCKTLKSTANDSCRSDLLPYYQYTILWPLRAIQWPKVSYQSCPIEKTLPQRILSTTTSFGPEIVVAYRETVGRTHYVLCYHFDQVTFAGLRMSRSGWKYRNHNSGGAEPGLFTHCEIARDALRVFSLCVLVSVKKSWHGRLGQAWL